jgi:hypothetical protein
MALADLSEHTPFVNANKDGPVQLAIQVRIHNSVAYFDESTA